jgi:hypothetical protein
VRRIKDRGRVLFTGVGCVKKFADDPQHAFPGHDQMKPERFQIARLKREVDKLKADGIF